MHLIILVHGMWGKAKDFDYIVAELNQRGYVEYSSGAHRDNDDDAALGVVYCVRSNEGYFTYDGIDVCGLRIANEITKVVSELKAEDVKVSEISIVGYSMGGLMIRYAIGLLYTRGMFSEVTPKVFVTTCSPHVGVNVLGTSKGARMFNALGSWSMARTSRQAFLRDSDQPHGFPLFLFLTQAGTACTKALALFRRRILYANIANDHRCEYYTSAVEAQDPFKPHDLRLLEGPYVPGYEPVVVRNDSKPTFEALSPKSESQQAVTAPAARSWLVRKLTRFFRLGVLSIRLGLVIPAWFLAFLINATYQRAASNFRTRSTLRSGSHAQEEDALESSAEGIVEDAYRTVQDEGLPQGEKLQLTPLMSRIVDQFQNLGFEKYLLRIIATPKAHSAAIMKLHWRKDFYEGKTAVKHLIDQLVA